MKWIALFYVVWIAYLAFEIYRAPLIEVDHADEQ